MPTALKNFIDWGYADGGAAFSHLLNARNHLYFAGDSIAAQDWADAKDELYGAADDFGRFGKYLLQDDIWYESLRRDWRDALYWINDNWPSDDKKYVLTMKKIMDEIWESTPLETFFFINYIDAMRAAIWNKSISAEKLHELYRHFSI